MVPYSSSMPSEHEPPLAIPSEEPMLDPQSKERMPMLTDPEMHSIPRGGHEFKKTHEMSV